MSHRTHNDTRPRSIRSLSGTLPPLDPEKLRGAKGSSFSTSEKAKLNSARMPRPPQRKTDYFVDFAEELEDQSHIAHTARDADRNSSVQKSTDRPRFMAKTGGKKFDAEDYKRRIDVVERTKALPKPPILRRESIFMDPSYRRIVRMKKANILKQQLSHARHIAFAELGNGCGALNSPMGLEGTNSHGNSNTNNLEQGGLFDDDDEEGFGELREEENLRKRQEQWLVLLAHASFLKLHHQVSEIVALGVLKRLFLPLLKRKLLMARRRIREKLLVQTFQSEIPELTNEQLLRYPPFVDWSDYSLTRVKAKFHCHASTPGTAIVTQGSAIRSICIISSGTVEPSWQDIDVGSKEVRELDPIGPGSCFGDYAVLLKESSPVTYRVGPIRVFYWKLSEEDYRAIAEDERDTNAAKAALLRLRRHMTRQVFPLTPHCMQNCGRNRLFQLWSHPELDGVIPMFEAVAFAKGEVIYEEGDTADNFIIVAKGLVDIVRLDNSMALMDMSRRKSLSALMSSPQRSNLDKAHGLVATLGPWQCIGDEACITGDRRAASVVARTPVDAWVIDKTTYLDTLMRSNAKLLLAMKDSIGSIKVSRLQEDEKVPAAHLTKDPCFKGCSPEFVASIAKKGSLKWFARRETIWKGQFDLAPVFVVLSGSVQFRPSHRTKVELPHAVRDGAVIGLAAALEKEKWPYSCALEGGSPVVAWVIEASAIQQALQEWGELHGTTVPAMVRQQANALVKTYAVYVPPPS